MAGITKFIWFCVDARTATIFAISLGHTLFDAPARRQLFLALDSVTSLTQLLMDCAYEDDQTRQLLLKPGYIPTVSPKTNRLEPWEYDRAIYKKRNEIERIFRRLRGFHRIFTRFDKLDITFLSFIYFTLIVEALR